MDHDESIWVMIDFISHHPITIPLTNTPNPQITLQILHTAFERIKTKDNVLETKITSDCIVPFQSKHFSRPLEFQKTPRVFKCKNPHMKSSRRSSMKLGTLKSLSLRSSRNQQFLDYGPCWCISFFEVFQENMVTLIQWVKTGSMLFTTSTQEGPTLLTWPRSYGKTLGSFPSRERHTRFQVRAPGILHFNNSLEQTRSNPYQTERGISLD